jgi:predicted TIM-barrel fold metal-dependent hydrolase
VNDWQAAEWLDKEPRLRASIVVPFEHADLAVAEIERRARDCRFVQVQFSGRPREPMGRRKYWPIYAACQEYGLTVMSHAFGSGGHPITGAGWPSFYIEDHVGPAQSMQASLISMVYEGVFERFPELRVVSAENGFGWAPSLAWRLDNTYDLLRDELPHLKRKPSEYLREHVWFCTQPVEEPEHAADLLRVIDQIGADRLIFASDYAHWDWDAPDTVLPPRLDEGIRRKILYENARQLYRLPDVAPQG